MLFISALGHLLLHLFRIILFLTFLLITIKSVSSLVYKWANSVSRGTLLTAGSPWHLQDQDGSPWNIADSIIRQSEEFEFFLFPSFMCHSLRLPGYLPPPKCSTFSVKLAIRPLDNHTRPMNHVNAVIAVIYLNIRKCNILHHFECLFVHSHILKF